MSRKVDMLLDLLDGIEIIERFDEHPEEIADQFSIWALNVGTTLEAAGMSVETQLWNDATNRLEFSPGESGFYVQFKSFKALLLGFLIRLEGDDPAEGLLDISIVENTRGYIVSAAKQMNGCYQNRWYDASMVMARRLLETLIIECYEHHKLEANIKDTYGNYRYLAELIDSFLKESTWTPSRNANTAFPKLKEIKSLADMAAHNRRFNVTFNDIVKVRDNLSVCVQELVGIAKFK